MHIGLLLCDRVRPELISVAGDYPDMFKAMFEQYAPQVKLTVFDIQAGQYPAYIDYCDAYISSGSAASVYDEPLWIKTFEAYLQQLHRAKKKFIGICFGHQMMAQALGAPVTLSNKGWGIGVKESVIVSNKAWMQPCIDKFSLIVSHRDQVKALPDNFELLATNAHCEIFMFQLGEHFMGLQGHPEFTPEYAKALMDFRKNIIPSDCLQRASTSLAGEINASIIVDWFVNFITTKKVKDIG